MPKKNSPGCGCCTPACPICTQNTTPLSGYNVTFSGVTNGTWLDDTTFPTPDPCVGTVTRTATNMTDLNDTFFYDLSPSGSFTSEAQRCSFTPDKPEMLLLDITSPGASDLPLYMRVNMSYSVSSGVVTSAAEIELYYQPFLFINLICSFELSSAAFASVEAIGDSNDHCKEIIIERTLELDATPTSWSRRSSSPFDGCFHCNRFNDGFEGASVTITPVWYE
jgi:hypothetical protein